MDAATWACAPTGMTWDGISWAEVQRQVRRLQARIVKATQAGKSIFPGMQLCNLVSKDAFAEA